MKTEDMTDREIDAKLGKALGVEPKIVWIVTRDGGKSAGAVASAHSPWPTKDALERYLREQHAAGLMAEYTIGRWEEWPFYSTTGDGMLAVIEGAKARGLRVEIIRGPEDDNNFPTFAMCSVPGKPMTEWPYRRGDMPLPRAVALVVLEALAALASLESSDQ